jgi:hypothetical protein
VHSFGVEHEGQLAGQCLGLGRPALVEKEGRLFQQGQSDVLVHPAGDEFPPGLGQQTPGLFGPPHSSR